MDKDAETRAHGCAGSAPGSTYLRHGQPAGWPNEIGLPGDLWPKSHGLSRGSSPVCPRFVHVCQAMHDESIPSNGDEPSDEADFTAPTTWLLGPVTHLSSPPLFLAAAAKGDTTSGGLWPSQATVNILSHDAALGRPCSLREG
jgi:hypothetical protein